MDRKTIVIMAGGTGGHIFPGLAVAQYLKEKDYNVEWLGAGGLENRLVPQEGISITTLPIKGLRGKGVSGWCLLPFRLGRAVWAGVKYLRKIRPNCVVGFGGFASVPGAIAAVLLRIPVVVHEQNRVSGLANRLLARLGATVLSGFECDLNGAIVVGNPVREVFFQAEPYEKRYALRADQPLNVLIIGGSQGARHLNQLIIESISELNRPMNIWHQAGDRFIDEARDLWKKTSKEPYKLTAFIENMVEAYAWADLVICRAGALTIAELMAVNVGSILVPFPYAVDDHQTKNAETVSSVGAAKLFQEKELDKGTLINLLSFFTRKEALAMAKESVKLSKPKATEDIVAVIEKVMEP